MKLRLVLIIFTTLAIAGCNNEKIDRLAYQNDSLRNELAKQQAIVSEFITVAEEVELMEGLKHLDFSSADRQAPHQAMATKLSKIHEHVLDFNNQVRQLRDQLRKSKHENSAYVMMMDAVKSELQIRVSEVSVLEGNIADMEQTNREISYEKEQEISKLLSQVNDKQIALTALEDRLRKLETEFRNIEAEAVYARALAVEESARKTRLAPSRKREALTEALELFKKARSLGKTEANLNITALEKVVTARSTSSDLHKL